MPRAPRVYRVFHAHRVFPTTPPVKGQIINRERESVSAHNVYEGADGLNEGIHVLILFAETFANAVKNLLHGVCGIFRVLVFAGVFALLRVLVFRGVLGVLRGLIFRGVLGILRVLVFAGVLGVLRVLVFRWVPVFAGGLILNFKIVI